ncbi:hypothetical protein J2Y00_004905 [Deinococcus soli (ex Cha et al. 2016)]|uniref:Uncharacterized protein n=2 Tax=Deinococcus soli (ex Cha et al. 2016) TaxID=1309411 RepID=A0ACC6KPV6_9DEIO|nr:hypothetical protein [Deinococcus soli (ex Cha et al. 2016)]MDR6331235.1 hypothetical protein [Deinococcus soli (ex Cha et al. 2016)]MDR6754452.1 hypothetical protein [Deinococcus soli (ex Cha et al. 2016)]
MKSLFLSLFLLACLPVGASAPTLAPSPAPPPCGLSKTVSLAQFMGDVVDGVIVVEPPPDTALVVPAGDLVLGGQSLRVYAATLCLSANARLLSFASGERPATQPNVGETGAPGSTSAPGGPGGTGREGAPGRSAALVEIIVTDRVLGDGRWEINTSGMPGGQGQAGGLGGTGGNGAKGRNRICFKQGPGDGGPAGQGGSGGTGGMGGRGGNAGPVHINKVILQAIQDGAIVVRRYGGPGGEGGLGGAGGPPGAGGSGGNGAACGGGGGTGPGNVAGNAGAKGPKGAPGITGALRLVEP